jgi:hypothetical protein
MVEEVKMEHKAQLDPRVKMERRVLEVKWVQRVRLAHKAQLARVV